MMIKKILFFCGLFLSAQPFSPSPVFAQGGPEDVIQNVLKTPDTAASELLILSFASTGITEAAAKTFSNMIAQNLINTNRFEVTRADDAEKIIAQEAPFLLPCFNISCGIQMGKIIGTAHILAGHVSLDSKGSFKLSVKMINVMDNSLEFEDSIRFSDENIDQRFYQLTTKIGRSTPLVGRIINANNKIAIIALGERDGLQVGDQLAIYKNKRIESRIFTDSTLRIQRQYTGILNITKVGDKTSQGVYFQSIETPEVNQFVITYVDKRKQIQLIDQIRKELDTHERTVYEITRSIELAPVHLEDKELKKWVRRVRVAERNKNFWSWIMLGAGSATAFFVFQYSDDNAAKLLVSLGILSYASLEYFSANNRIDDLIDEGRYRGYLELKTGRDQSSIGFGYRIRF
jgi:hypothetical protein